MIARLAAVLCCIVSPAQALPKRRTQAAKFRQWKPREQAIEIFSFEHLRNKENKKISNYSSLVRQMGHNFGSFPQVMHRVIPGDDVTVRRGFREDGDVARDRHFAAHPEDRDANVVLFEFYEDEEDRGLGLCPVGWAVARGTSSRQLRHMISSSMPQRPCETQLTKKPRTPAHPRPLLQLTANEDDACTA